MSEERFGATQITELPPLRVACYRAFGREPEKDASEYLTRWRDERGFTGPFRHFGFDTSVPDGLAGEGMRGYEVWVTVPPQAEPSADVSTRDFSGGTYATMTIRRPFDDPFAWIPAGWERLRTWVQESDEVAAGEHQWLEELVDEDLHLYHPVRIRDAEAGSL